MFGNLKIRGRMFLGFGLVIVMTLLMSAGAYISGNQTINSVLRAEQTASIVAELKDALLSMRLVRSQTWEYVATGESTASTARTEAFAKFEKQYEHIESRVKSPEGHQLLVAFHDKVTAFTRISQKICDLKAKGQTIDVPEFAAAIESFGQSAVEVAASNNKIADHYDDLESEVTESANNQIRTTQITFLFAGLIAGILGVSAAYLISRSIANPIQAMTEAMGALASGNLSVTIPASDKHDEVGEMAKAVQVFKDNALQVTALRQQQEQATLQAAAERRKAMISMADSFESSVMGVVKEVSNSASEMQVTSQSLSASAQQASTQATAVAAASEQASSNVQTVAAAAEELSASISEISRQVSEAARISTEASEETARTNTMVLTLSTSANKIGEVVNLINDIASQTNLLALNATIEAARAGDAGKGFAVVANEVKNLATQTGRATDEISGQINAVQEETKRAVAAIQNIGEVIERVRQISAGIASAVEQQGAATRGIAENVQQAARGTQEVSSNINGVTQAAELTGAAADRVLTSAKGLSQNSERLHSEVTKFLGTVRSA